MFLRSLLSFMSLVKPSVWSVGSVAMGNQPFWASSFFSWKRNWVTNSSSHGNAAGCAYAKICVTYNNHPYTRFVFLFPFNIIIIMRKNTVIFQSVNVMIVPRTMSVNMPQNARG